MPDDRRKQIKEYLEWFSSNHFYPDFDWQEAQRCEHALKITDAERKAALTEIRTDELQVEF